MAYSAQYSTNDVTSATIDGATIFVITIVGLMGVIALILVGKWAIKSFKRQ
jgi:flagellar biogenesis protein FliO